MWLIDLSSDGACIVPGSMPLGRASNVTPMIFLAVCKAGILTLTSVRDLLPTGHHRSLSESVLVRAPQDLKKISWVPRGAVWGTCGSGYACYLI